MNPPPKVSLRAARVRVSAQLMAAVVGFALLGLSPNHALAQVPVINYGDSWKFKIPSTDPGTAWRGLGFDETGWGSGPGLLGFETATLPSPGIQTAVGTSGSPLLTYLFRKTFTYSGTTTGMTVVIDQIVDDGVAYYLNGNLLGSVRYAPGGAWNAGASPSVSDAVEELNALIIPAKGLINGTNVLSAEVHQSGPNGSDLVFGARIKIVAPPAAAPGLQPVAFSDVVLADPFWAPRIETNRTVSLPDMYQSFVANHNLDNFAKTAGLMVGDHDGLPWADSDVYKTLEGMAYAIKLHPDSTLQQQLEGVIAHIVAAQRADGYLDTYIQLGNMGRGGGTADWGGESPAGDSWQAWEWPQALHEDYCMGHMMEAAVAHYEATGRGTFLNVARKNADYLHATFGPAPKRSIIAGHEEVELALMRLGAVPGIGKQSDFDLTKFYVDEHGRQSNGRPLYGEFCQDLYELRETSEPLGHGVRGPYLWAASTDVAARTGDTALLAAMDRIWTNVVERKMYVTGGMDHRMYNEGFGPDYDLPPDQAYNETCAACAMMFWSKRLANLHYDSKYTDLLERVLYNGFATGRSIDGSRLSYNNYVTRTGPKGRGGIVCCATNIVRTVPSVPGYQYATQAGDGIWVHLYMAGQATVNYGGVPVGLQQVTNYPWDGSVRLNVTSLATPTPFTIHLRIPEWAAGATATVNGQTVNMAAITKGYLPITRTWQAGDFVQLSLPMSARRVYSHPKVWADRGRVAIARGPMIYCLESNDNTAPVHQIVIPKTAVLTASAFSPTELGGVVWITGTGINATNGSATNFKLVPYAVWDNRSPNNDSLMTVMIPETTGAVALTPDRGRLANATITYSYKNPSDNASAINDGILGSGSDDQSVSRFTWWSHKGTPESITYTLPQPIVISRADIMWFNDGGECDFPSSFQIQYLDPSDGLMKPVVYDADYNQVPDLYAGWHPSIVRFAPVTTTQIRLAVQLKPNKSGGVLEWRLPDPDLGSGNDGDADGDGMANLAEYLAGTDPANPASRFLATAVTQAGGVVQLAANVVAGKTYELQSTTDLLQPWTTVPGSQQTASVGATQLQWSGSSAGTRTYWRVRLVP